MSEEKFVNLLEKQESVIEKKMEDGFKLIAAELKAAMAESDARLQKELTKNAITIAKLETDVAKRGKDINVLFEKVREIEAQDALQEKYISQQKGSEKARKEIALKNEGWLNRWIPSIATLLAVLGAWLLNKFFGGDE